MPQILFVCTANQFRSPLAAAYFARRLRDASAPAGWTVASAGTWAPAGLPAHPKALTEAAKLGLDLSAHRTREVDAPMLAAADLIVVMEQGHREALECEFPACRGRIVLLAALAGDLNSEIPDPARTGFTESSAAARTIAACIDKSFPKLVSLAQSRSAPKSG